MTSLHLTVPRAMVDLNDLTRSSRMLCAHYSMNIPNLNGMSSRSRFAFLLHTSLLANGIPSVVLLGFQLNGFLDAELEKLIDQRNWKTLLDPDWVHAHASRLADLLVKLYKRLMTDRQKKYMENYAKKRRPVHFVVGDLVWMHLVVDSQYGKLGPRMLGPFRVVSAAESTYHLEDLKGKKWPSPIHVQHLQACNLNMPDFHSPDYDTLAEEPDRSSSVTSPCSTYDYSARFP